MSNSPTKLDTMRAVLAGRRADLARSEQRLAEAVYRAEHGGRPGSIALYRATVELDAAIVADVEKQVAALERAAIIDRTHDRAAAARARRSADRDGVL